MRIARCAVLAVAMMGPFACLAPGALAAERRGAPPEDQVLLSGTIDVPRGRTAGEVVVFHGAASIAGVATGDVVVFSGRINVTGQVSGDVVNLDGTIVLAPTAQVRGDVVSRGAVVVRKGAQVQGSVRDNALLSFRAPVDAVGPFATWLAVTVSSLVVGFVLLWLAPRGSVAVSATARRAPWASTAWGIGLLALVPVLSVGLAFTLVGLPLALALMLASALALFVGYAWSAWIVGRLLIRPPRGRIVAFLVGMAVLRAVGAVPVIGGATWILGGGFGLGAVAVAVWNARGLGGKHRPGRTDRFTEPADLDVPGSEGRSPTIRADEWTAPVQPLDGEPQVLAEPRAAEHVEPEDGSGDAVAEERGELPGDATASAPPKGAPSPAEPR